MRGSRAARRRTEAGAKRIASREVMQLLEQVALLVKPRVGPCLDEVGVP